MDAEKNKKKGKITFINPKVFAILALVAIIFIGIFIYRGYMESKVEEWTNKIYPKVIVDGTDLTGKTKEEAIEIINKNHSEVIGDKKIIIAIGSNTYTYKYSDISAGYDIEGIIDKAINYGKNLSVKKQYKIINKEKEKNFELTLSFDKEKLIQLEEQIKLDTKIEAKDASITINLGTISIEDEGVGYEINIEKLHKKLIDSLNGDLNEETKVELDLIESKANITAEELALIKPTPMSTYSTDYSSSSMERSTNVEIATSLLNGTLLMPGDIFSYSDLTQKGRGKYLNAPVYVNNEVELAEAGGICQVSSTLYNAIIRSNIRSVERINHSLPVSYVPLGLDATMSWGYLDYKFKNTYDFPVYIEAVSINRKVIINVYGDPNKLNGVTYDFVNEIVETINPEIRYIDDNTLAEGTEAIEYQGQTGYKVKSYLVGYKGGIEVSRELIATDNYAKKDTKIRRGTNKELNKADNEEGQPDNIILEEEKEEENTNNN